MKKMTWKKIMSFILVAALILSAGHFGSKKVKAEGSDPYYVDESNVTSGYVDLDGILTTANDHANDVSLDYTLVDNGTPDQYKDDDTTASVGIVLVLDFSNSMSGDIRSAKDAAEAFCQKVLAANEQAPNYAKIAVIVYAGPVVKLLNGSFSNDLSVLTSAIEAAEQPAYGTNTQQALIDADGLLDGITADNKVIVLMSDGAPNFKDGVKQTSDYDGNNKFYSETAATATLNTATDIKGEGTKIYTLAFCKENDEKLISFLQSAATSSDYAVTSSDALSLKEAFGIIAEGLTHDITNYAENIKLTFKLNDNFKFDENDPNFIANQAYFDNVDKDGFIGIPIEKGVDENWIIPDFKLLPTKSADEYAKIGELQEDGSYLIYGVETSFVTYTLPNDQNTYFAVLDKLKVKLAVQLFTIKYYLEMVGEDGTVSPVYVDRDQTEFRFNNVAYTVDDVKSDARSIEGLELTDISADNYEAVPEIEKDAQEKNTFNVTYILKSSNVYFKNEDGQTDFVNPQKGKVGQTVTVPGTNPSDYAAGNYNYTFEGWTLDGKITTPADKFTTSDVTYVAQFNKSEKEKYTV